MRRPQEYLTLAEFNQAAALWTRPKSEITDQEYSDFYRHVAADFTDPLAWVHSKGEGTYEYTLLLFIPARAPYDLWIAQAGRGVKLHIRRVFVMEDNGQLLPTYLREVERELHRLADSFLPGTVSSRALAALEARGIVAYVGDPVPGHLGGVEVPLRYRRSSEYLVTRASGQPADDARQLTQGTLAELMRLHPTQQAANEIRRALSVLTHNAWPEP